MTTGLHPRFIATHQAINGWCAIPSPVTTENMGRQGFNLMAVDLQHGLIDDQMALSMVQILQGAPAPVLTRPLRF